MKSLVFLVLLLPCLQALGSGIAWIRGGHAGLPGAMALSPDGRFLASVGEIYDRTVKLWNATDGNLARTFGDHSDRVNAVTFSPTGEFLATAGRDAVPRIWRVADGSLVSYFHGRGDWINGLAFSPDGQFLASSSYSYGIQVWRVADAVLLHSFPTGSEGAVGVSFTPQGAGLLVNVRFDKVRLYDMQTGGVLPSFLNQTQLAAASISQVGDMLLGIPADNSTVIRRYSFPGGTLIGELQSSAVGLLGATYTSDGSEIVAVGAGKIERWESISGQKIGATLDTQREIYGFQASAGPSRVWTMANVAGIEAWNPESQEREHPLTWHRTGISTIRFLPDGEALVSASLDGTVNFWRSVDGQHLKSFSYNHGELTALVLEPTGHRFAIAAGSHVGLYNASDGDLVRSFEHGFQYPRALAITGDGESLYAGGYFSGKAVAKWRIANGETQLVFFGSNHGTHDLALSPDGEKLVTGGYHRQVAGPGLVVDFGEAAVWNAHTGEAIGPPDRSYRDYLGPRVAFSKDGAAVGIAGGYSAGLNRATTNERIWAHFGSSTAVAFSNDGRFVAHAAIGGIQVSRVADGTVVAELLSETRDVSTIAFSPDDRWIAWGRGDGTLVVAANSALDEPPGYTRVVKQVMGQSGLELTIAGDPFRFCLLWGSQDFSNWTPLEAFPTENAPAVVVVPVTESTPHRFFRALSLPLDSSSTP